MTIYGLLSIACLVITGSIATLGVFSRHYDDTLIQRVGLSALATACWLRIPIKFEHPYTPPELLLGQVGLTIYAIGCIIKLSRSHAEHHHHRRGDDLMFRRGRAL